jgi:dimeric dUTPase (all-alpha-NTP-PPase superfamily)
MKTEQLITMLQLQDRINSAVNPNWRGAGNEWSLAIMVECAELIDHIGWKWWKKQDMNLPQARIELVDIWHFFLSRELEKHDGLAIEVIAAGLKAELDTCNHYEPAPSTVIITSARRVAEYAAKCEVHLFTLVRLWKQLGMTDDDLFYMYVGKAALNLFRQEHGYKDGTYIKNWYGHEDNVYLEGLLARGMVDLDEILVAMEHQYANVRLAAASLNAA